MTHVLFNDPPTLGISEAPAQGLQRLGRLTKRGIAGIALELRVEGHQGPQGTWDPSFKSILMTI